jgi:hypothetical protein
VKITPLILRILVGLSALGIAALGGMIIGLFYAGRMSDGSLPPPSATKQFLATVLCAAPKLLRNGQCTTPPAACPAPQVLQNDRCITPPPTCIPPQELHNGQCAAPSPPCAAPKMLQNGHCVTAPPRPTIPSVPGDTSPGAANSPGPTVSSNLLRLSWGAVSGATSYKVAVRDMTSNALVVDASANSSGHAVTLHAGGQYRWDVDACNSAGCSSFTTPLYFQTP